jgi:hypothetical protein
MEPYEKRIIVSDNFETTMQQIEQIYPARLAEYVAEKMLTVVADMRL